MHIENVHENTDLQRLAVGIGIKRFLNSDDTAVGRAEHICLAVGSHARRIAKKLQHKQGQQPENQ